MPVHSVIFCTRSRLGLGLGFYRSRSLGLGLGKVGLGLGLGLGWTGLGLGLGLGLKVSLHHCPRVLWYSCFEDGNSIRIILGAGVCHKPPITK